MAVFRNLRRPGRQLASARQLSGLPRGRHCPPDVAHERGSWPCCRTWPLMTLGLFRPVNSRSGPPRPSRPWNDSSGSGVTFSTGTTPARLSRFLPAMFRPLIVETLSAICSPCARDCCNWPTKKFCRLRPCVGWGLRCGVLLTAVRNRRTGRAPSGRARIGRWRAQPLHRLEQLQQEILRTSPTLDAGSRLLARLANDELTVITELTEHPDEQVRWWADALMRQAQAWLDEVNLLAPLGALPPPPPLSLADRLRLHETDSVTQLRAVLERIDGEGTLRDIAQLSIRTVIGPRRSSGRSRRASRLAGSTETAHQRGQRPCRRGWHPTKGWPERASN